MQRSNQAIFRDSFFKLKFFCDKIYENTMKRRLCREIELT